MKRVSAAGALAIALWLSGSGAGAADPPALGFNKIELAQQYLGIASGGDGGPAFRRVERAMARKAMADARQIGAKFFRVAITGFAPSRFGLRGDLELWLKDPPRYWAAIDDMMADLRRSGLRIVPVLAFNWSQFPAMTGETLRDFLTNPNSRSFRLLAKYVAEFLPRYKDAGVVMVYELTNELNMTVDIDLHRVCLKLHRPEDCEVETNIASDELVGFTERAARLVKREDPSAQVSSGFSTPRPAAEHLRRNPVSRGGRTVWTQDSEEDLEKNIAYMHRGVDIVSVHVYPGELKGRFGRAGAVDIVRNLKAAADQAGKKLYIGEFGDSNVRQTGDSAFIDATLDEIAALRIPYASLWAWEFYQYRTYQTYDGPASRSNLEPGYTDGVLAHFAEVNRRLGEPPPASAADAPPRVVLTWPLDCQAQAGEVKASAVASAAKGRVARVEFWLDGAKVATSASPPYAGRVDLQGVSVGLHDLAARAYDGSENAAEYRVKLVVGDTAAGRACEVPPY